MGTAVLALIAAALLVSPFFPGLALALSSSTYTFRGGLDMPDAMATLISAAPFFCMVIYHRRFLRLRPMAADYVLLAYFGLVTLLTPFTAPIMPPPILLLRDMLTNFGFYLFGRAFIDFDDPHDRMALIPASAQLLIGLSLIGVTYVASPNMQVASDRAVLGDLTAVGLALGINVWICVCFGVTVHWVYSHTPSKLLGSRFLSGLLVPFALASLAYSLYLLVQNGTRGSLVAVLFGAAVVVALPIWKKQSPLRVLTVLAGIVFLVMVALLIRDIVEAAPFGEGRFQRLLVSIASLFGYHSAAPTFDPSSFERSVLRANAWSLFFTYPILGCGYFCTSISFGYPHNLFLEALAEGGIVCTSLLAVFFGLAVKSAAVATTKHDSRSATIACIAFFSLLLVHQVSYSMQIARILFAFTGAVITLGAAPAGPPRPATPSGGPRRRLRSPGRPRRPPPLPVREGP